ncbi:chemotaxis protein CheB [Ramlibacter alkalitolerans]|uniref:protein-glutamate methylesterase n=1 Tax=Ramlibacter alkalitolerans TaxID=2039631 RepID=A0ABS1JHA3_9BURK|nr:chemotaxis protein CheB [Ramlibacter alkalitolerans]MBL0423597.1 chemotaxis protein CheB [Ramlibacter alkalitolerans]
MKRELPADFAFAAEIVAIGASAGGVEALLSLFTGLAPPLRAAVVIVLHLPEGQDSRLVDVFALRLRLPVQEASPHAPVQAGHIYFAPPGYHLLVEADRSFSLSCDPPVLFSRPAIDVLFESCAEAIGENLAALLLTGANEDGAEGLARIHAAGGLTAVQDPDEAAHPTMPAAALRLDEPDFVLPLAGLRSLLHTVIR